MFNVPSQFAGSLPFGMFSSQEVPFGLATLMADPNCALIQDPSQVWGVQDFLPRRNLLLMSNAATNTTYWKYTGLASATAKAISNPIDSETWSLVTSPGGVSAVTVTQGSASFVAGTSYTGLVYLKKDTHDLVQLTFTTSSFGAGQYANIDLTSGTVTAVSGCTCTLEALSDGWYRAKYTAVATSTVAAGEGFALVGISSGSDGRVPTLSVATSRAVSFAHAMVCRTDTIDQSYQKITNWTSEQYAWAAQKNVAWLQSNVLIYTDDLTNAAWTKSSTTAPSAGLLQCSAATAVHEVRSTTGPITPVVGQTYYLSCKAKQGTSPYVQLSCFTGMHSTAYANFNLSTGSAGTSTACTPTITGPDGDGFYTITIAVVATGTPAAAGFRISIQQSASDARLLSWAAAGTENVNVKNMGLYVGSLPSYQAIGVDWDTTYTAAATAAGYPISIWQDSAGTKAVNGDNQPIGKMLNYKLNGLYDATQATTANQPKWRLDANGKAYIERDGVNDALPVTFPNLGSNCAIYVGEGSTVSEATGQTLNGSYAPLTPAADYGRVIFTATPSYAAKVIKWLLAKAGY